MSFKKKSPKPPKPSLAVLLKSGDVKTGAQVVRDEQVKAKHPEARDIGVRKCRNGYYIDLITAPLEVMSESGLQKLFP